MPSYPGPFSVNEAFSVRDQAVIVTGAAGLIGSGVADIFAANGARVVASDRASTKLTDVVARVTRERSAEVIEQPAELTNPDDLSALVRAAVARFGGLHTLVHCGAIVSSSNLESEDVPDFDRLFHTNLRSAWLLAKYALPHLEKTRGCMIGIASVNGHRALFPCSLYGATKAGLINMSGELAAEFGHRQVRFNTISPGLIRGEGGYVARVAQRLHPPYSDELVRRFEDEEQRNAPGFAQPLHAHGGAYDIAMACVFLASPAARFVTGADLLVDGAKLRMFEQQLGRREGPGREFWIKVKEHLLTLPDDAWQGEKPEWLSRKW